MATLGSTIIKGNLTVNGTINGYTLAAASEKAVDGSLTAGTISTNIPTSKAVVDYVNASINSWKTSNTKPGTKITMSASGATITATIGETGYFTSGTNNTYTVPSSKVSATKAKASATSSATLAKGSDGVGSAYAASKPSSGYYVSFTATPSSTLSLTSGKVSMTAGYVAAQDETVEVDGTTSAVNGTTKTGYITLPSATFSYNTTSSGATFIQCRTSGYIGAGSLSPSGTYDKLSYSLSYNPSVIGVLALTSYDNTSKNALDLSPVVDNFDSGYVGTAADLGLKHIYLPLLTSNATIASKTSGNVATTTSVTGMKTATSGNYKITISNSANAGSFTAKTTTSLKDATGFKGATYGLANVGNIGSVNGNVDVTSTIDGAASPKTIFIQAGSSSLESTATGIQTATSGSYYVHSKATITEGYQGASTPEKTIYIKSGAVSVANSSEASTSTSLSGTTLTVARSVSPSVTEGYVKSGSAGTITTTATVPTESKTATAGGTINPSSGRLLSSVVVPSGTAKNGYVITGGFIAKNTQVYTLSYNSTTKCVDFVFNQ